MIYRLVSKFSADRYETEDIVQDVFMKLFIQLKTDSIEFPKTWLYKVASNMCVNTVNRRKETYSIDEVIVQNVDNPDCIESKFEEAEQQEIIRNTLLKLDEHERLIIILYSEGLSYKEIAEISGVKFTSIGKTLSRTLEKLKPLLKGQYDAMLNR